jgi:NAD(P)-dependent dehydrogenase (short-subunit alcohol dehydrogenase family)
MSDDYLEDLFGLQGQVAVVIGATGVLGGAIAEGLARAGAIVVVSGRGESTGNQVVARIQEAGGEASFLPVDATSRGSIQSLLDATLEAHGGVDLLVNAAGVNAASSYLEASDADWDRVMDTNLKATHFGCQVFGRQMISQQSGAILNIGSATVDKPLSRVFAYSASKAAVANLTQNVAREFAPHGVRVNCLCPGFFPAEQNRKILDPQRTASIMQQTPMGRFGNPEELIGASLLLLSSRAGSFITGSVMFVDGGFTAMRF